MFWSPETEDESTMNAYEVVTILERAGISCPLSAVDLVNAEDSDMLLVLLSSIHRKFKSSSCALPLLVPVCVFEPPPPFSLFNPAPRH